MRVATNHVTPLRFQFDRVLADAVHARIDAAEVFAGHFPASPVLPGVLVIELVRRAALALGLGRPGRPLVVDRARFLLPVLPGDELQVLVTRPEPGRVVGVVRTERGVAARITLTFDAGPS